VKLKWAAVKAVMNIKIEEGKDLRDRIRGNKGRNAPARSETRNELQAQSQDNLLAAAAEGPSINKTI